MATAKKAPAKKAAAKHTPRGLEQDRKLVSSQSHEIAYEAEKLGVPKKAIKDAKKAVGPARKAIEKKLKK